MRNRSAADGVSVGALLAGMIRSCQRPARMDRWQQYLFAFHSEPTLRAWAKRLHMFRFFRAFGGHSNDGDELVVVLGFRGLDELLGFFEFAGIKLVPFEVRPAQPEPGKSYPIGEFAQFPQLIPGTRWLAQPEHQEIGGQQVFVWCSRDQVKITIGSLHEVSEADVAAAEIVEKSLAGAPLDLIEPPVDSRHCICPKYYPDYFP